ncbi:death-associated protein kinase 1-like isoform X1 [Lytechinus pictus]|uniref:death-associated protein kinase 1-like isoform X1 n=1 Tax=Lytechinus pictus TaxID=7653 RepID=UPI0030B9B7FE
MAVFHAVEEGNLHGIKELVENLTTYDPDQKNKHGETALHLAAGYGHVDIIRYLQDKGATIDVADKHGDNAVYWAARQGQIAAMSFLKDQGCRLDAQNKTGETPLHVAGRYGQGEAVQYLCDQAVNMNLADEDGETPLHIAAWHGYTSIVQTLCKAGATLDLKNKDGETTLLCAAARGHLDIVKILVEAGALLNTIDKHGITPLHHSVRRQHYDIVKYLVDSNCDVNLQDKLGDTPLNVACKEGALDLVEMLHAVGAKRDILNRHKNSALHMAARGGHIEVVRYLCLAGSLIHQRNQDGLTASQLASLEGHEDVADVLTQLEGDKSKELFINQLNSTSGPLHRIRIKVLGHSGVGKTTLIDSLKCGYFRGLFRRSRSNISLIGSSNGRSSPRSPKSPRSPLTPRSPMFGNGKKMDGSRFFMESLRRKQLSSTSSSIDVDSEVTRGIEFTHGNIPGAGDFTFLEFSGEDTYHTAYPHFLSDEGAIHLVVFSLEDMFEEQLAQVTYWMNFLRSQLPSSEPVGYCGKYRQQPKIALVATHADHAQCPKQPTGEMVSGEGNIVLYQTKRLFGRLFDICDVLFVMDAHIAQSKDIKMLRTHISSLRNSILKVEAPVSVLCEAVASALPSWRRTFANFPVLTWQQFSEGIHASINPLAGQAHLRDVGRQLHLMGEVQCFSSELLQEVIVIEPTWLCSGIIGRLLSHDATEQPEGQYSIHYIQSLFPDTDAMDISQLMEAMDICVHGTVCEIPAVMRCPAPESIWEKEDENGNFRVYGGVRMQLSDCGSTLPSGLFSRIQMSLRRNFQQDMEDTTDNELLMWRNGAKCSSGSIEGLISMTNNECAIEIKVRGYNDSRQGCFIFLEDLVHLVKHVLVDSYPGLPLNMEVLSPVQLSSHEKTIMVYDPCSLLKLQLKTERTVENLISNQEEDFVDIFCFGSEPVESNLIAGVDLHILEIPSLTRRQISMLLDPPDPMGKDWCLLAVGLGLTEKIPMLDTLNRRCGPDESDSPTERLLQEWGKEETNSVGLLLNRVKDLGREDVSRVLMQGSPLYKFVPDPRALEEGRQTGSGSNHSSSTVASR